MKNVRAFLRSQPYQLMFVENVVMKEKKIIDELEIRCKGEPTSEINQLAEKYVRASARLHELESHVLHIEEENRALKEQLLLNPWKRLISKSLTRKKPY